MKPTLEQKGQKFVKSTIHKVINNISIIAIFVALGVILLCYAGLTFNISVKLVVTVAVSSIVLAVSSIIIYELWMKNGAQNAREEKEYIDLLNNYDVKSKDLNSDTMQEFIEAEKKRRHDVEEKRLQSEIERVEKIITNINKQDKIGKLDKVRLKWLDHKLVKLHKMKDNIIVDMPYVYSEQFDQLRYNVGDINYKEYKPNDTALYIRGKRIKKYTVLITTTLVGFNAITPSIGGQHWLIAFFMTIISAIALISSLISGFSHGYNSIAISSTGVYKTALSFIDKAEAYCKKYNKNLRNSSLIEMSDIPKDIKKVEEVKNEDEVDIPKDIKKVEEVKNEDEVDKLEESPGQITMNIFDKMLK